MALKILFLTKLLCIVLYNDGLSIGGALVNHGNGTMSERELRLAKRKRRGAFNSDEEDEDYQGTRITEERYRSMLGEHIQKYKRRFKDTSVSQAPPRMGIPTQKSNLGGSKMRKLGNEQRAGFYDMETTSEWMNDVSPQRLANYHEADLVPKYGIV